MAINRFDRPVNLDYNYTPYMPELFMPDFNAIIKAGQVQDQITEESNKLASTKPNYIPTTQYTAYDEHGNPTTKSFGDETAFRIYERKQRDWQDRLTKAKLSGDANVFNSERDRIASEVKESMLPDGLYYNLDSRYKNYVTQLQNMQKEKSMDDAGYKTAGNYGNDLMNFYNNIGEYKNNTSQVSSNFGYNITPYTDIYDMLDKYADNIKSSGYNIERDTVNGRFIVRDKDGKEEVSPEKIKAVLDPFIQDPRVQQQLRVESYNKATYTPEELTTRIENAKVEQTAYLDSIKSDTKQLTEDATKLGIDAKGKTDEQLYDLINKKLEEDRTSQLNQYSSLDANQRRALMLQENYQNKYVGSNITSHAWKKTDDIQQLRYDDLYMINYKANADLKVAKDLAVFNKPKNGIIATSSASTPQDLKSLFKVQENLYQQYDVRKQQLEQTVGTSDRLLSPDEFASKFGGVSDDNAYNAYKQEYQSMEASKHRASGLYNQLHSKDNDYAGEVYDKMSSTDKQQLDTFMKNQGITDRAQGLRAIYEYTEKQKESSPASKTGERKVNNSFAKYFNSFEDKRNKGIENGEIQVQTIGFTPLDGSEAETVQKTIDNIYTNPDKKFALLKEAVSKGLIKPNELPDKTGDKFKVIIGTIPGTGQLTLNASYLDSSGQPHSFILDESSIPSEKQVFEVWKQSAKDAISDQAGNITSNNPNTKVIAQTIAEHNINTLIDSGNLSTEDFNNIKQQYKNKPELLAKTLSTPIFSIKAGGNTTSVTYDPSSVVNPYKEDRFFINTKDANGKITTNMFEGSFDDLKSTIGWSLQRDDLYQQEKPHPILNKQ